jgi:Lhr-like helicase
LSEFVYQHVSSIKPGSEIRIMGVRYRVIEINGPELMVEVVDAENVKPFWTSSVPLNVEVKNNSQGASE